MGEGQKSNPHVRIRAVNDLVWQLSVIYFYGYSYSPAFCVTLPADRQSPIIIYAPLMSHRRIVNVGKTHQRQLAAQFPWLIGVDLGEQRRDVQVLSVSVFDRWLSREEACAQLESVPPQEQARRDVLLADFCALMVAATEVISFAWRGRQSRRIVFRAFLSKEAMSAYCRPHGGRVLGSRHFHAVLPELRCAFYESWDPTYHLFFTQPGVADVVRVWANVFGVYLGVYLLGHEPGRV